MKRKFRFIAPAACSVWLALTTGLQAQSSTSFSIRGSAFVNAGAKSASASFAIQSAMGQGGVLGRTTSAGYAVGAGFLRTLSASLPEISLLPGNPPAGSDARVRADIVDPYGMPVTGTLYYRQAGRASFSSVAMTAAGNTFTGVVPAASVTLRGLEIYISATNGADVGFFPSLDAPSFNPGALRTGINANAPATGDRSYRLVSFPFQANPPTALAQIADNITGLGDPNVARLFWWDPVHADTVTTDTTSLRGYREFGNPALPGFIPGRSMFLATNGSKTYNGVGLSTLADTLGSNPDYVQLPIDSGWNMIATPYGYPVAFDTLSVLFPNNVRYDCPYDFDSCVGNWTDLNVRAYTGTGYAVKKVLEPWKGYYVFSKHPGRIYLLFPKQEMVIPDVTPKPANEHEVNWPTDWKIAISAKSGDLVTPQTILGVAKTASKLQDNLDLAIPPALAGDIRVAFQKGKEFGLAGDYLSDIRPTLTESETWSFTVEPGGTRAIELNFDGLADVQADYDLILIDKEGRAKQNLRLEPVYRLIASGDRHFELTVTPKTSGEVALLPTKYDLYQNLPNPFNPQTLIKYDLPEAATVRLEVFNILGQKVATLVDRFEAAGPKSTLWDGTDAKGGKVSSGIYFYKISAGDYVATKKMMLVK